VRVATAHHLFGPSTMHGDTPALHSSPSASPHTLTCCRHATCPPPLHLQRFRAHAHTHPPNPSPPPRLHPCRLLVFAVVLFHALEVVATDIAVAGGTNLLGISLVNPMQTLINLTLCFQTLAIMHLLHAVATAAHATPFGDHCWNGRVSCNANTLLKGAWAVGWAVALIAVANSRLLLGVDLFGGPVWLILCLVRLVCIVISEGVFSPCGCGRTNRVRAFFMRMERVYMASPEPTGKGSVIGWEHMRQPRRRVCGYTGASRQVTEGSGKGGEERSIIRRNPTTTAAFWALLLAVKVVLDLHILTQQAMLVETVEHTVLQYNVSPGGRWVGIIGSGNDITSPLPHPPSSMVDAYCAVAAGAVWVPPRHHRDWQLGVHRVRVRPGQLHPVHPGRRSDGVLHPAQGRGGVRAQSGGREPVLPQGPGLGAGDTAGGPVGEKAHAAGPPAGVGRQRRVPATVGPVRHVAAGAGPAVQRGAVPPHVRRRRAGRLQHAAPVPVRRQGAGLHRAGQQGRAAGIDHLQRRGLQVGRRG